MFEYLPFSLHASHNLSLDPGLKIHSAPHCNVFSAPETEDAEAPPDNVPK